jgi:hypothetical protein
LRAAAAFAMKSSLREFCWKNVLQDSTGVIGASGCF